MGFDVTYHPISIDEMYQWYFNPLQDATLVPALAKQWNLPVESVNEFFANQREKLTELEETESFESVHGLQIAAVQGLQRCYFYNRGCLITDIVTENPEFQKYVLSFQEIVPEPMKSMTFVGGIDENWCGGVFIPPQSVKQLMNDLIKNTAIAKKFIDDFGVSGFRMFWKSLLYANKNQLGLLEATEVIFPFGNESISDSSHCVMGYDWETKEPDDKWFAQILISLDMSEKVITNETIASENARRLESHNQKSDQQEKNGVVPTKKMSFRMKFYIITFCLLVPPVILYAIAMATGIKALLITSIILLIPGLLCGFGCVIELYILRYLNWFGNEQE
jgi:hypothetical protein